MSNKIKQSSINEDQFDTTMSLRLMQHTHWFNDVNSDVR